MDILFLLVPLAVVLAFFIGMVFCWSVRSGQFDDLDGPARRILLDRDDGVAGLAPDVRDTARTVDAGQRDLPLRVDN